MRNVRIGAVSIVVDDYDAAIAHYTEDLPFELAEDLPQNGKRWVTVRPRSGRGTRLVLAMATTDDQRAAIGRQTGDRVGFFVHTDDFAATHAHMTAAGVRFAEEPRDEPYGTVAVFSDRYGNRWDLLEPRRLMPDDLDRRLRGAIRAVPDFPQPGVLFRDVSPVLADPRLFAEVTDGLAALVDTSRPDLIAGIDARGFIFGTALAGLLGVGFVPIRKAGKLPGPTVAETYELEYGSATIEMQTGAAAPGHRVVLVDDLIATGGTMAAAVTLIRRLGAEVAHAIGVVDLPALGGSARVAAHGVAVSTLVDY